MLCYLRRNLTTTCPVLHSRLASRRHARVATHLQVRAISKEEANKALARRMIGLLNGDKRAFRDLQVQTSLYRAGLLSPLELRQHFERALGTGKRTQTVLIRIAHLLPTGRRRDYLLAYLGQANSKLIEQPQAWSRVRLSQKLTQDQLAAVGKEAPRVVQSSSLEHSAQAHMPRQRQSGPSQLRSRNVKSKLAPAVPATKARRGQGVLLWLRSDLRIHDNPTLDAAVKRATTLGGQLVFCYISSPEEDGDDPSSGTSWRPAGASLVWQQASLASLDADLCSRYGAGAAIVFREGPYLEAIDDIVNCLNIGAVYFSRRHEPVPRKSDLAIVEKLVSRGLEVHSVNSTLLHEPEDVTISTSGKWGGHFGTLTPFLRSCDRLPKLGKPVPSPASLPVGKQSPVQKARGVRLEELGMVKLPRRATGEMVRWDSTILDSWVISESAALGALEEFASTKLAKYESSRHLADAQAVSKLSPYIHSGQLSARQVLSVAEQHGGKRASKTFWRRLVWRDLAYWQLHHWPEMPVKPIRTFYAGQEWRDDPEGLRAWRKGHTGFPMVDAGMRQLWRTGWMQQSVRMICALFLTEYLNIEWVHGCRWFHECLVDADLAINSMMWQNAGKSGLDQWNFTLLPSSSSQDPSGHYVKRWVPEIARLPPKFLHQPWSAPSEVLAAAGITLGETYPQRVTGSATLQELRSRNRRAICEQRHVAGEWVDDDGYDMIVVPQGSTTTKDGQKIRIFTKREYRSR